jgi:hypothetical protein
MHQGDAVGHVATALMLMAVASHASSLIQPLEIRILGS